MPRLSYANIAATLAVVVALGGTAHAAGLPRNSVGAKQIKNNSVTTKDLKDGSVTGGDLKDGSVTGGDLTDESVTGGDLRNGSVTGADLNDDSLTGSQVKESSLGIVPSALDAAELGGLAATGYRRSGPFASGSALNNVPLQIVVSGYGTYRIACDTGGSSLTDDEPFVGYTNSMGAGTFSFTRISAAPDGGTPADVRVYGGIASAGSVWAVHRDDSLDFDLYFRSADGAKAIHVYGIAADDSAISGCAGFITADVIA